MSLHLSAHETIDDVGAGGIEGEGTVGGGARLDVGDGGSALERRVDRRAVTRGAEEQGVGGQQTLLLLGFEGVGAPETDVAVRERCRR
jgi:hypothetical protein